MLIEVARCSRQWTNQTPNLTESDDLAGSINESRLVEESRGEGTSRAFGELVTRYERRLVRVILQFVKNQETAEDLAQETFLKVYEAASISSIPRGGLVRGCSGSGSIRRWTICDVGSDVDGGCCSRIAGPKNRPIHRLPILASSSIWNRKSKPCWNRSRRITGLC